MKKLLFILFVFCMFMQNAQSQINLNFSDLGVPVRSYDLRVDTAVVTGIVPGAPGTNQTWNFMALHSTLDTMHIDLVNSNVGVMHNFFPNANVAYHIDNLLNYSYYNSSAAGLLHYGVVTDFLGTGDSIKVVFSAPDTSLKLPANYQTICNSVVMGDSKSRCTFQYDTSYNGFPLTVPIDTLRIKHKAVHYSEIDAWGTMTTPTDIFPALRQKNIVYSIDSIYGYANVPPPAQSYSGWYRITIRKDTAVTYNWWMKGLGIPAVTMEMYKLSNYVTRVSWVRDVYSGISENADENSPGVYPNPAHDMVTITKTLGYSEAMVYDVLGNEVSSAMIGNRNEITFAVGNLPNGMYFYNLMGKQGKTSGKFVVKH